MQTESSLHPGSARALYIGHQRPCHVRMEGQALVIQCTHMAECSVPLRHIARIHLSTRVDMSLQVLARCTRRGIPVVVADPQGEIVLRALGREGIDEGLRLRLQRLSQDFEWPARFDNWHRAQMMRATRIAIRRLGWEDNADTVRSTEQRSRNELSRHLGKRTAHRVVKQWHSLTLAWMQAALQEHGIDARSDAWVNDHIDLASSLAAPLERQLLPLLLQWAANQENPAPETIWQTLIDLFEGRHQTIERTGRDLLNRLHRWLVEND